MKNILIAIMLLFSTATMAQRLSVLGIEMGTSIDKAEKILKERYGEYNVFRTGNTELNIYDALVAGSWFRAINFEFQSARYGSVTYTFLSHIKLQKPFNSYSSAKSLFNIWEEKLVKKYTVGDVKEFITEKQTENDVLIYFKEDVWLQLLYSESKGGDYFWYVTIDYYEDFVDESNDY
jgi:hypothetical protein